MVIAGKDASVMADTNSSAALLTICCIGGISNGNF